MATGRPVLFDDRVAFQKAVDEYFEECDKNLIKKQHVTGKGEIIIIETPEPYTMAGLAHHLGMSRETLNQYKKTDIFSDIISQAREKIHRANVTLALVGCHESRIAALNLASNFGYSTKNDVEATGEIKVLIQNYGEAKESKED